MDVWFCKEAGTIGREAYMRSDRSRSMQCALSQARLKTSRFLLTEDLHGCRLLFPLTDLRPFFGCFTLVGGRPERYLNITSEVTAILKQGCGVAH